MFILVVAWLVTVPVCHLREILYILPKLATMSALCSWHVHCLGQVIRWSDRNRQGLLTRVFICICVFCRMNKVNNALQTCMSLVYFRLVGGILVKLSWCDF